MTDATQTIWHQSYLLALETLTSLRNHCDFTFEKDTKNARTVKILNASTPTVRSYVSGTAITRDSVASTAQTLTLDQQRYINIGIDDVVKAQTVKGGMEAYAKEGTRALANEGDKYVASVIKTEADDSDTTSVVVEGGTITKTNVVEKIEDVLAGLYANNVSAATELYMEVDPTMFKFLRPAMTELSTNNPEMIKKGILGKYGNAMITIENLLPISEATANSTKTTTVYNVIRTGKAVAFAEQIDSVETYRPEDAFEDALKALYVFGALVVRPKELGVLKTVKKTETV